MKFKNDKERMEFVKNNDNWETVYQNPMLQMEIKTLEVGQKKFVKVIGFIRDEYSLTPKDKPVEQFESIRDSNGYHLEHRNNGDIVKAIRECRNV